ncbi:phenylalanyl-tRNA synthetase subunit beta [Cognatiyoonia sp. IB215446]|uniref:phenylalanyl-tRNA synthetase subunit beta n=1 Tax=Cognatiyoonia sp. IB215446 TaxID=3097355 RepID=UPI002A0F9610|nr:phenylalanyl-tRNA synthetase subunit beta [Cognatiyoonia sp. IB215446]MDX8346655.1 phenylalanyl-tRNA synthetase subunit beta [Cognatiyoonia sp. IB215446]
MMRVSLLLLLILIVGAHIAMWTSDMSRDLALKLTLINAAAWAVILLPVWAVSKWAAAHKHRK